MFLFLPHEWVAAGIALATTAIGAIVALLLASYGVQGSYLVFLVSVIAALAWGGATAGVVASLLASMLTWFFFVPPLWSFALPNVTGAFTVVLVLLVALVIILSWMRQQRTIDDLTDAAADLKGKRKREGR
jgi:K+-sensing histidine kinase KdpD